jgi:hypothetical protein
VAVDVDRAVGELHPHPHPEPARRAGLDDGAVGDGDDRGADGVRDVDALVGGAPAGAEPGGEPTLGGQHELRGAGGGGRFGDPAGLRERRRVRGSRPAGARRDGEDARRGGVERARHGHGGAGRGQRQVGPRLAGRRLGVGDERVARRGDRARGDGGDGETAGQAARTGTGGAGPEVRRRPDRQCGRVPGPADEGRAATPRRRACPGRAREGGRAAGEQAEGTEAGTAEGEGCGRGRARGAVTRHDHPLAGSGRGPDCGGVGSAGRIVGVDP